MKSLFYLPILFVFSLQALAQSSPAKILQRVQRSSPNTLNARLCTEYLAVAKQSIAQGRLQLDDATLPKTIHESRTFWEMLDRHYEITSTFVNGGDMVPQETQCYNECMIEAIEAKYGRGILQRVASQADSLNRIGKGFQNAHPAGVGTAKELFEKQFAYKVDFRQDGQLLVNIRFDVDSRGQTSNLRLHWCPKCIGPMLEFKPLPTTHRYYAEARRLLRRSWKAATLNGRPVKTTISVLLG